MGVRIVGLGLVAMAAAALVGCGLFDTGPQRASDVVTQSFAVQGKPAAVVDTFSGSIRVNTVAAADLRVEVTKRGAGATRAEADAALAGVDVTLTQDGDTVRVTARRREGAGGEAAADVVLRVPPGTGLELRTGGEGGVSVAGAAGDVTAETGHGPIEVTGPVGALRLTAGRGRVHAEGLSRRIDARTGEGAVELRAEHAVVAARSPDGPVQFTGSFGRGASAFETTSGPVVLKLLAKTQFDLDAQTQTGTIETHGLASTKELTTNTPTHIAGPIGRNGSAKVTIRTGSGKIEIDRAAPSPVLRAGGGG